MLATILRAAALIALSLVPLASAAAADDDTKLVESIPPEVADVVSGGSWSADKKGGFYRAFVIMSGADKSFGAHVYLQWLALSNDSPIPTVVTTTSWLIPRAAPHQSGTMIRSRPSLRGGARTICASMFWGGRMIS